ncbi:MAG: aminoglycoside phosphotransferase family protein [Rhizobiaceae bacterium]
MTTPPVPPIDADLVRRLVQTQFPHWAHLPVEPIVPGGWDNRTFRLGSDMMVRLPSAASYTLQVEKEQEWLPKLAPQLPLPIPTPLAKGEPGQSYFFAWSVYDWLPGEPANEDRIDNLVTFARDLAGFLNALRKADAAGGPLPGQHNFWRGGPLKVYDQETRDALTTLAGNIDVESATSIWDDALASSWNCSPVWFHGDIAWGNLLVENGCLCGVIDFGTSGIGDPACDLAITWTFFSGESRAAFRDALNLDEETWARGRAWTLWKALITVAGHDANQREADKAWRVLRELLSAG